MIKRWCSRRRKFNTTYVKADMCICVCVWVCVCSYCNNKKMIL